MSATSPDPRPTPALPSTPTPDSPALSVRPRVLMGVAEEPRDLIREVRLMAAGQFFGLPLSQAHARAVVAHLDQLIEDVETRDALLSEVLEDLGVARTALRALVRGMVREVES